METGYPILSEDFVEVRTSGWLLCSLVFQLSPTPLSDSWFLLLRSIRIRGTSGLGGGERKMYRKEKEYDKVRDMKSEMVSHPGKQEGSRPHSIC